MAQSTITGPSGVRQTLMWKGGLEMVIETEHGEAGTHTRSGLI